MCTGASRTSTLLVFMRRVNYCLRVCLLTESWCSSSSDRVLRRLRAWLERVMPRAQVRKVRKPLRKRNLAIQK